MSNFIRMSERDFRDLLSIPERSQRIVDILESYPISESAFSDKTRSPLAPSDYMSIIESLLQSLYGKEGRDENLDPHEPEFVSADPVYILRERSMRIWHEGLKKISFISLYPHSMIKLIDRGELVFSDSRMGDLFRELLNTRKILKDKARDYLSKSQMLIKVIINMTYGMFYNSRFGSKTGIFCRGMNRVPEWSGRVLRDLAEVEDRNIVSVDVDDIYLYEINDRVLEALKTIDIPYEISDIAKIMWTDKKKLVELDSDGKVIRNTIGLYKRSDTYYDRNFGELPHFGKSS